MQIHEMTLRLPKYEMYEVGSQVRRSAKSIPANIAEGFGRRRYKNEYIRFSDDRSGFLRRDQGSSGSAAHRPAIWKPMHTSPFQRSTTTLGKKLNRFLQQVIAQHVEPYREDAENRLREDGPTYDLGAE